jgi:hypothetical protein
MSSPADEDMQDGRKPWAAPMLRRIKLSEEELAELKAADDPMDRLLKLKPELGRRP